MIVDSKEEHHNIITPSGDFYTMSTFRDLLFHVQEHRFTIPKIKDCLAQLGLTFCGFEADKIIVTSVGVSIGKSNHVAPPVCVN